MAVPVAEVLAATNIERTMARLNGKITDDGGASCEARFRYGKRSETAMDDYEVAALDSSLLSGFPKVHSLVYYNNYVYGITRTDPGKVIKIDASDLSSYDTLTPQHNSTDAGDLMEIVQAGGYLWTVDDNGWLYKIDPSTLTVSASLELTISVTDGDGSLCADGTYIYIGGYGDIARVRISDSATLEKTIDATKVFHSIAQYGDYVFAHSYWTKKLYKVLKSDLSLDSTSDAFTNYCATSIAIDDTYVYLAKGAGSGGIVRVAQSDLTISELATGISMGLSYGVYRVNDGVDDRLLNLDYENNSVWVLSMPSCSLVRRNDLTLLETEDSINELASDGTYVYLTQWVTSGNAPIAKFSYSDIFTGTIWTVTEWQNTLETDDTYYEDLVGLEPDIEYDFQTQAKNDAGEGDWSSSEYFDTRGIGRHFNDATGRLMKGQNNFPYIFPFSFYANVAGRAIQSGDGARVAGRVSGRLIVGQNTFPYTFPFSFYTNVAGRTIKDP